MLKETLGNGEQAATRLDAALGAFLAVHVLAAGILCLSASSYFLDLPYRYQLYGAALLLVGFGVFSLVRFGVFALGSVLVSFGALLLVSRYTVDLTYDGMHYHLPSALEIAGGRNLFFEEGALVWSNIYPSGTWRLLSFVMHVFPTPNPGLVLNGMSAITLLLLMFKRLGDGGAGLDSKWETAALVLLIVFSPVVMGQLFSAMVDGLLVLLFLILAVLSTRRSSAGKGAGIETLSIISVTVLLGSTKTSALYFLTILYVGLCVYEVYRARQPETFAIAGIKRILALGVVSAVLILFVNYRPYITNVIVHGALLPDPEAILSGQKLSNMVGLSQWRELAYLVFGATDGNSCCETTARLKVPFFVYISELGKADADPRVGGFGPFFGALFLLAVFLWIRYRPARLHDLQKDLLAVALISIVATIFFPEPWWARFVPMLAPAVVLLYLVAVENVPRFFRALFIALAAVNALVFAANAMSSEIGLIRLRAVYEAGSQQDDSGAEEYLEEPIGSYSHVQGYVSCTFNGGGRLCMR